MPVPRAMPFGWPFGLIALALIVLVALGWYLGSHYSSIAPLARHRPYSNWVVSLPWSRASSRKGRSASLTPFITVRGLPAS